MSEVPEPPTSSGADAVLLVDGGGLIRYMTPEAVSLLGGARATAVDQPLLSIFAVDPEEQEAAEAALGALRTGARRRVALQARVRDMSGSWRVLALSAESLLDVPEVGRIVVHLTDVTARTDLEEQLRRAQRMEAVGRLASGIAHDFRNALTVIRASAHLARESLPPGHAAVSELAEIAAAADRATSLTEQLLSFGRRDTGGRGFSDVNQVIEGVRPLLEGLMGESVRVRFELEPGLALAAVEATQVEQVLMNLAANARAAMPGGGEFLVRTSAVQVGERGGTAVVGLEPGWFVALEAQDDGTGMDQDTLAHVFEPFFTTHEGEGASGLGLATVYGIVTEAGGQIHARSDLGRGTLFRAYLPLA